MEVALLVEGIQWVMLGKKRSETNRPPAKRAVKCKTSMEYGNLFLHRITQFRDN